MSPFDRHLPLLHRLEQRRLRLRRGAVDLVREEEVREDRARPELEVAVALVPDRRARHVRRHEVGRELDAGEAHAQNLRERARGERLREARVVLEQDVSVREEAEPDELERLPLADDRLLDLVEHLGGELLDLCELHQTLSSASTTWASSRGGIPFASRSSGAGRSGRTSSQASSPRIARAVSGVSRERHVPPRAAAVRLRLRAGGEPGGSGDRTSLRSRGRSRARCVRGSAGAPVAGLPSPARAARSRRDTRAGEPAGGRR